MDFYTAAQTVAMTPVKQIDTVFTTPTRTQPGSAASRRAPLTRTLSSPAFSYGLPAAATSGVAGYHAHRPSSSGEWSAAMSRRDSTSSFASSMDSFPMTPLTEEFISPDQIFRHSGSFSSGMPSVRPRSVTQGTHDLAMTPYLSSYNGAAKMQRRHTHMGEVTPMSQEMCASPSWQGNPYEMQGQHMEYTPGMHQQQLIAQQAAYAALHAHSRTHTRSGSNVSLMATPGTLATPLRATPMQHTTSSPLSEMSLAQMNVFEAAQYIVEEQETDADAGTAAVPVKTPTKGPATPVKRAKKVPLVVSDIKDKPHVCPHCSARFARLEHVKRHERTHTGAKPFLCSIEGCGEVFSRSDNLRAHERTHARAGRNTKAMAKKKLQAAQSASMTHSRSTSSEDGAATTSTAVTATPTSEKPQRASPKHRAAAKAAAKAKTAVIAPQPAITSAATSRDPSPVMEQSREAEMQSSQQAAAIALNQGSHFAELQPGPTAEELEADYLFQEELMQQQAFLFQQQQLHLPHQQQQHLPQEGLSNQYKVEEAFGQYAYTDAL